MRTYWSRPKAGERGIGTVCVTTKGKTYGIVAADYDREGQVFYLAVKVPLPTAVFGGLFPLSGDDSRGACDFQARALAVHFEEWVKGQCSLFLAEVVRLEEDNLL